MRALIAKSDRPLVLTFNVGLKWMRATRRKQLGLSPAATDAECQALEDLQCLAQQTAKDAVEPALDRAVAVEELIALSTATSPAERRTAGLAVTNRLVGAGANPTKLSAAVKAGVVRSLVERLADRDEVMNEALRLLAVLAKVLGQEKVLEVAVEAGCIPPLVGLLGGRQVEAVEGPGGHCAALGSVGGGGGCCGVDQGVSKDRWRIGAVCRRFLWPCSCGASSNHNGGSGAGAGGRRTN